MAKSVPIAIAIAATLAGCGEHRSKLTPVHPLYVPSATHANRVPGTIYPDEVGENIVGLSTPYARVVKLFGPPFLHRGDCVYYRMSTNPTRGWRFCFTGGRMASATGNVRLPG